MAEDRDRTNERREGIEKSDEGHRDRAERQEGHRKGRSKKERGRVRGFEKESKGIGLGPSTARRRGGAEREREGDRPDLLVVPLAVAGTKEKVLEELLHGVVLASVLAGLYPRTAIQVIVQVVHDDGSVRADARAPPSTKAYVSQVAHRFFIRAAPQPTPVARGCHQRGDAGPPGCRHLHARHRDGGYSGLLAGLAGPPLGPDC